MTAWRSLPRCAWPIFF